MMNIKKIIRLSMSYLKEILFLLLYYNRARKKYKNSNIWLISERGTDARDNGAHLFRYIRTNHPEQEVYYVISADSNDLSNVERYGNILYANSKMHRLMFYGAKVLISTHLMGGYTTNQSFYMHFNKQPWFRNNRKIVSIKHGITKDNLPVLYKENAQLDLLICGAKTEYDYISTNFHYKNDEVQYTGFARFDKLSIHTDIDQILVMPTWRTYLAGIPKEDFAKSEYYLRWNSFLNSDDLKQYLAHSNMKLVFYPHHDIQPYISMFNIDDTNIVLADSAHYDVQKLLIDSKVLITDYSSVYFDFAYMLKPVIYYQFDRDRFFSEHYKKGYFDYYKMGFGPVADNEEDIIKYLYVLSDKQYAPETVYNDRMAEFFPVRDNNNCLRIYNAIVRINK